MAVLVANKDGKSNAKAGDIVVTGGGIYEKNADGTSTLVESLKDFIGTAKTKDYNILNTIAESYKAREGSKSATVQTETVQTTEEPTVITKPVTEQSDLLSGVQFTPLDYSDSSGTGSSEGASKILGYVVLGLVGIAVLDRFINR